MTNFIRVELKRNCNSVNIILFVFFWLILIILGQIGINHYRYEVQRQKDFIEVEWERIINYINYQQYGAMGYRRFLQSSPFFALTSNATTLEDVEFVIDSGIKNFPYKPEVSVSIFKKSPVPFDYSQVVLFMGSAIAIFFGFITFFHRQYYSMVVSKQGYLYVYVSVILSRLIIIASALAVVICTTVLQFYIFGVLASIKPFVALYITSIGIMIFFYVIGAVIGLINRNGLKGVIVVIIWFLFTFLIPGLIHLKIYEDAIDDLDNRYQIEGKKLKATLDFENEALTRTGRYDTEKEKRLSDEGEVSRFWTEVFTEHNSIETSLIAGLETLIDKYNYWSIFTPTTHYFSTINELSSKGFLSYMQTYKHIKSEKDEFLKFYFEKRFFSNYPENGRVKPFLKKGENVLVAESKLPKYYGLGIFLNQIYNIILVLFCFYVFRMRLIPMSSKDTCEGVKIILESEKNCFVYLNDPEIKQNIINVFFGNTSGFNGVIHHKVDELAIDLVNPGLKSFQYIPHPGCFPKEMRIGDLIKHTFRFSWHAEINFKLKMSTKIHDIPTIELIVILLKIAMISSKKVLLIDDLWAFENIQKAKNSIRNILKKSDKTILCLFRTDAIIGGAFDDSLLIEKNSKGQLESRRI